MGHVPATSSLTSPERILERAIRNPSSTVWLGPVRVITPRFEEALDFYSGTLGLSLRTVERHPLHIDRLRAVLIDAEGRDMIELVETPGDAARTSESVSQLSFRLPKRSWHALRARLNTQAVGYTERHDTLILHDPDGLRLKVTGCD
ncbi:MAG: hypothetical protein AAGI91_06910 [Bacteroidota bacterium]